MARAIVRVRMMPGLLSDLAAQELAERLQNAVAALVNSTRRLIEPDGVDVEFHPRNNLDRGPLFKVHVVVYSNHPDLRDIGQRAFKFGQQLAAFAPSSFDLLEIRRTLTMEVAPEAAIRDF